jgi:hypothetical protein
MHAPLGCLPFPVERSNLNGPKPPHLTSSSLESDGSPCWPSIAAATAGPPLNPLTRLWLRDRRPARLRLLLRPFRLLLRLWPWLRRRGCSAPPRAASPSSSSSHAPCTKRGARQKLAPGGARSGSAEACVRACARSPSSPKPPPPPPPSLRAVSLRLRPRCAPALPGREARALRSGLPAGKAAAVAAPPTDRRLAAAARGAKAAEGTRRRSSTSLTCSAGLHGTIAHQARNRDHRFHCGCVLSSTHQQPRSLPSSHRPCRLTVARSRRYKQTYSKEAFWPHRSSDLARSSSRPRALRPSAADAARGRTARTAPTVSYTSTGTCAAKSYTRRTVLWLVSYVPCCSTRRS